MPLGGMPWESVAIATLPVASPLRTAYSPVGVLANMQPAFNQSSSAWNYIGARCPSQKDRWFGGIPQSLNVIASGAKQSHRIPLYLQARGDCFVVLLYGRTPRNDIHITPRLGELEGVERRLINKQPTKLVDTLGGLFWTGSSTLPPSPLEILKGLSFRFSEDEPFSLWQSKQFNAIIHRANLTANSHQFWE